MKSLVKRSLRAIWRTLSPLHGPLLRKIDNRIIVLVEATVRPLVVAELEQRVRPGLDATTSVVRENIDRTGDVVDFLRRSAQENTLLLDSLVRELIRVQMQLETLREQVQDNDDDRGDHARIRETSPAERLMIG